MAGRELTERIENVSIADLEVRAEAGDESRQRYRGVHAVSSAIPRSRRLCVRGTRINALSTPRFSVPLMRTRTEWDVALG